MFLRKKERKKENIKNEINERKEKEKRNIKERLKEKKEENKLINE